MANTPITLEMIASLVAIGAGLGAVFWRLLSEINKVRTDLSKLKDELHHYQMRAAQEFASFERLAQFEDRVTEAIRHLGDRLDQWLNRTKP